jgi:hypothetical protein
MGVITLDLPVVGQPNTTEDVKVRNNFQTLQNTINGNIDASNLSPIVLSQLGNFKQALSAIQVQDIGNLGQIRAGRVLTPADFTNMGLSAPLGLWNLGTVNDASGSARNLTNKGTVTFDTGITGSAAEAAVFTGSTGQALYIVDTGAADPFRIRTGSWGCWFRTAKRGVVQEPLSKMSAAAGQLAWMLQITTGNVIQSQVSPDGTATVTSAVGTTDVCDDRWHFVVGSSDGSKLRLYVDGALEAQITFSSLIFNSSAPLNIGGRAADASTATANPFFGRVDEAFVTADVLSPEQVYNLYCTSIPHTLGVVPTGTRLAIRRTKRGGTLATTSFPATPVRLHNFTAGSLNDEGSNATPLVSNPGTGAIVSVVGADGASGNAYSFSGAHTGLSATDTGLPSGLSARSFGAWIKTTNLAQTAAISWGNGAGTAAGVTLRTNVSGQIGSDSGADLLGFSNVISDGLWHQVIVVEDNSAIDGIRRKLYTANSTVLTSVTLGGANRFRIGAYADGTAPWVGQIDGAFVHAGTLTPEQVKILYNIGSQQLAPSPKDDADNIEALELTRVLAHFDNIEGTELVDLAVVA